jgi:hypothetical protein
VRDESLTSEARRTEEEVYRGLIIILINKLMPVN